MKTIRAKIWAGFGIVVILAAFLGVYSAVGIKSLVNNSEDITNEQLPMLITDSRLAFNIAQRVALSRGYILYGDEKYIEEFNQLTEESAILQEELEQISSSENIHRLIASSLEWREVLVDQVFPAVKAGRQVEAERLDREIAEPLAAEIVNEFNALAVSRQDTILTDGLKNVEKGKTTQVTNIIIAIVVILLAILISFYMARSISIPVVAVSQRMERMAEGIMNDLPLETRMKDEVGQQIHSINKMRDEMQRILSDSLTISRQVNSKSAELSKTSGIVSD